MNGLLLFVVAIGYAAALFAVAWGVRRRGIAARDRRIVYTLGLAVYWDHTRDPKLQPVLDRWAEGLGGLLTFGRQGLFAHDNTHHALESA